MTTIKISGFLYARKVEWIEGIDFSMLSSPSHDVSAFGACLGPASFDYELGGVRIEDAMLRAEVEAREREKNEATRRFSETVAKINDRLSKLRALTNEVPAASVTVKSMRDAYFGEFKPGANLDVVAGKPE